MRSVGKRKIREVKTKEKHSTEDAPPFIAKITKLPVEQLQETLFILLGIEILMEKYSPKISLSGYPNEVIIYSVFFASQR